MSGSDNHVPEGLGTPHGFGNDPRSRRLRRRPSERLLAWAEETLGAQVRAVRALRGGSSSAIHALSLAGDAAASSVILRSYVLAEVVEEEPDIVEREAEVLGLLRGTPVPTPEPLGSDPTGASAGIPALLMTRLPGRPEWSPKGLDRWLHDLAQTVASLHNMALAGTDGVQEFRPYQPESWAAPAWMQRPELWERAVEVFHRPPMDPDRVFLNRDYHPGNVLWRRERVSGVVDWQAASIGPRSVDVCHCRFNLLDRFGLPVADLFVRVWERTTDAEYHPWAEVVMAVDAIGSHPDRRDRRSARDLETVLALRLAELGA